MPIIIEKNISELIPYIGNSRTHSDEQISQIAASIKEFDITNPILLDGKNGIIAGHGRVLAAKKLNLKTFPCIELSHLSEDQKKAYIIADNQLATSAGWDYSLLKIEIEGLKELDFDIDLLGFDSDFLGAIIDEVDCSDKNNELDLNDFDDSMEIVFSFNKEQHETVLSRLLSINESKEIALMQVLDNEA